jgi:hypothetical protein
VPIGLPVRFLGPLQIPGVAGVAVKFFGQFHAMEKNAKRTVSIRGRTPQPR